MAMFTKRTMAALFTIAIASSLIVVGGFVGSAFAAKKVKKQDEYGTVPAVALDKAKEKSPLPAVLRDDSPKSHSANAGDSGGSTGGSSGTSTKDLKSLSKCESGAAADGDLTQAEVRACYHQVF